MRGSTSAIEAIPLIRERLAEVEEAGPDPLASGRRAALWRVQAEAARPRRTLADLRGYCLEKLTPPRFLDERDSEYLRGYREGLQAILADLRRLESG